MNEGTTLGNFLHKVTGAWFLDTLIYLPGRGQKKRGGGVGEKEREREREKKERVAQEQELSAR